MELLGGPEAVRVACSCFSNFFVVFALPTMMTSLPFFMFVLIRCPA